jgi:lipid-binding SYLF domain-containing protein
VCALGRRLTVDRDPRICKGDPIRLHLVKARLIVALTIMAVPFDAGTAAMVMAASASQIDPNVTQALNSLYKNTPGAKALADKAVAVLVFPSIVKGGFIIAGQFGDGALRKNGKSVAFYRSLAASYGFQAGAQA